MSALLVDWALAVLKMVGAPGSMRFLALCCGLGLVFAFVWPKRPKLGRAWLLGVFAAYFVLGTPAVAHGIADGLSPIATSANLRQTPKADVVVLLAGDNIVGRLNEAIRTYHAWQPSAVIVSAGDEWDVEQLVNGGIPRARIVEDPVPANTFDQLIAIRKYQSWYRGASFALIASRLQMLRVDWMARALSLDVRLLASPADAEPPRSGMWQWVPRYTALRISRDAIYERTAMAYYSRWRGFDYSRALGE